MSPEAFAAGMVLTCKQFLSRKLEGNVRTAAREYAKIVIPVVFDGLTRVQTHKVHQTMAATRQIAARKFLASLS
jgi:hypothetical protein